MISRRLIRLKVMQIHYGFLQSDDISELSKLENDLNYSIEQSYNLFLSLHCLLIELFDLEREKIEIRKNKLLPSPEDLNPNTKFIDNEIIKRFKEHPLIQKACKNSDLNWVEQYRLINNIHETLIKSEHYQKFMNNGKLGIDQDYDIITYILEKIVLKNKLLEEILEDRNIFWNDDIEFWISNILQYLKKHKKNPESFDIPDVWRDEEDKTFAFRLLKFSVLNRQKFDAIIVDALQKWELERLALVDRSLLHLAICEYTEMPEVPVKVTINEYIEISKYYSTEKSSVFINGILDKIHLMLKEKGQLIKEGRGLADC